MPGQGNSAFRGIAGVRTSRLTIAGLYVLQHLDDCSQLVCCGRCWLGSLLVRLGSARLTLPAVRPCVLPFFFINIFPSTWRRNSPSSSRICGSVVTRAGLHSSRGLEEWTKRTALAFPFHFLSLFLVNTWLLLARNKVRHY